MFLEKSASPPERRVTFLSLVVLVAAALQSPFHASADQAPNLCFVPIGAPRAYLATLQDYYGELLDLKVAILPPLTPPADAWNSRRGQWIAETLSDQLAVAGDTCIRSGAIVIGILNEDMYLRSVNWTYAFSWRHRPNVAVVSYARMDPRFYHEPFDAIRLVTRLRRMITKDIGVLMFHLPLSRDRRSPLYGEIDEAGDLDRMSDDIEAAGFPPPRRH
jgi:predicted Zn-dependent protease